jgi:hypothetical protein
MLFAEEKMALERLVRHPVLSNKPSSAPALAAR